MMAYEQKDMSGSVFKNKKMDRDTSPNLTGSCKIDGKEYWVNAWTKTDKNGDKWLSLGFKEKQPRPEALNDVPMAAHNALNDDIPF
jgi:hypothetical protein